MTLRRAARDIVAERTGRDWCLFLDRDGVINERIVGDYVRCWEGFVWTPGGVSALQRLCQWAPHVVVVTNQQGVGKGLMSESDVAFVHEQVNAALAPTGAMIEDFLVCPHLQSAACPCRKPAPGLVLDWLARHPTCEPSLSIMVGDSLSDLELSRGVAAAVGGCSSIFIGSDDDLRESAEVSFESLSDMSAEVARIMEESRS